MGHPVVENQTPLACEPLFITDEGGRPVLVPVVKATYEIGRNGRLALAEQQRPVSLAGERWDGSPDEPSSYKYEPEVALTKPATDIVLVGSAHTPGGVTRELDVTLRVGPLAKTVHVTGDRTWTKRIGGGIGATSPEAFERIPLVWERAFGGWDRSGGDAERHTFEPRNPVGTGFRRGRSAFEDGIHLPNLEDPDHRVKSFGDTPPPAAFGFVSPDWQPRAKLAGTYDQRWIEERMPLLPTDFDPRFFNAAAPGLVAPGHLKGDEPVVVRGTTPKGELGFRLPGVPPPTLSMDLGRRGQRQLATRLDTVIINTDESLLLLLWRGEAPVVATPEDVRVLTIMVDGLPVLTQ